MKSNKIKVFVIYRVAQFWRLPLFVELDSNPTYDFRLVYFSDFKDSKVVSGDTSSIPSIRLPSLNLSLRLFGRRAYVPIPFSLFFYLIRHNPDVILCEGASNLFANVISVIYASIFRKRIVQWGLGEIPSRSVASKLLLSPFILFEQLSSAALTYSQLGSAYYSRIGFSPESIFVATNTIDNRSIQPIDYDIVDKSFNIIYIGAFTPQKKPSLLLDAFIVFMNKISSVNSTFNSARLSFVGDGPDFSQLVDTAFQSPIKDKISFHGKLVGSDLSALLKSQHLTVMPGLGGLVVSESISYGIPVLASNGDGSEIDWLENGCGTVVPHMTIDVLVSYLLFFFQKPETLLTMHRQCGKAVAKYGFKSYYSIICSCIEASS